MLLFCEISFPSLRLFLMHSSFFIHFYIFSYRACHQQVSMIMTKKSTAVSFTELFPRPVSEVWSNSVHEHAASPLWVLICCRREISIFGYYRVILVIFLSVESLSLRNNEIKQVEKHGLFVLFYERTRKWLWSFQAIARRPSEGGTTPYP